VTLIDVKIDDQAQASLMLSPLSNHFIQTSGHKLSFKNIDDYGAVSEQTVLDIGSF
jgi:P pilus assembly chaperone PapD